MSQQTLLSLPLLSVMYNVILTLTLLQIAAVVWPVTSTYEF